MDDEIEPIYVKFNERPRELYFSYFRNFNTSLEGKIGTGMSTFSASSGKRTSIIYSSNYSN